MLTGSLLETISLKFCFCPRPVYSVRELEIKNLLERKCGHVCVCVLMLWLLFKEGHLQERGKNETSRNEIRPVFIQFSSLAQDVFLKVCKLAFQFKLNK
jgi:hypothetical protein